MNSPIVYTKLREGGDVDDLFDLLCKCVDTVGFEVQIIGGIENNDTRKKIHEFCRNNNIRSTTIENKQGNRNMMQINGLSAKMTKWNLHYKNFYVLIGYLALPIPVEAIDDPGCLEYMIDMLIKFKGKPLENAINYFNDICLELDKDNKYIGGYIGEIKNKMADDIRKSAGYKRFMENRIKDAKYSLKINKIDCMRSELFVPQYVVSIDMVKANFTSLHVNYPDAFVPLVDKWEDYVSRFTNSKFVIESKYFRQLVFGELASGKLAGLYAKMTFELASKLYEAGIFKEGNFTNDEIVICSDKENVKDTFLRVKQLISQESRPEIWKINIYCFQRMRKEPIRKRIEPVIRHKIIDPSGDVDDLKNNATVDIKCCDKKYYFQALKYYWGEPVCKYDLKMALDGELFTLDRSIF